MGTTAVGNATAHVGGTVGGSSGTPTARLREEHRDLIGADGVAGCGGGVEGVRPRGGLSRIAGDEALHAAAVMEQECRLRRADLLGALAAAQEEKGKPRDAAFEAAVGVGNVKEEQAARRERCHCRSWVDVSIGHVQQDAMPFDGRARRQLSRARGHERIRNLAPLVVRLSAEQQRLITTEEEAKEVAWLRLLGSPRWRRGGR